MVILESNAMLDNAACRTRTLIESIDLDLARLAAFSTFDKDTLVVTPEFPDEDSFLDEVEEEYGLLL